ncbi:hypothetical protein, partial [Pseudophaeobacter sp.]|uniref:hypothetical protein n=2 Tax=Pseudophaeobacter sp. TaxID=1971739 RepID=UPI003297C8AD
MNNFITVIARTVQPMTSQASTEDDNFVVVLDPSDSETVVIDGGLGDDHITLDMSQLSEGVNFLGNYVNGRATRADYAELSAERFSVT